LTTIRPLTMPRKRPRRNPMEHFPARPRKDGRFQKRINGVLYYFGRDGDRDQALREYDATKRDLYAGRKPKPPSDAADMTMREVVNRFLFDRKGVIEPDTYRQHRRALRRFVKWCGAGRAAVDLGPDDFSQYGRKLRAKLGGYAYNRERAAILAALNHADAQGWIERVPKLGAGFKRTPKSKLRAGKRDRLLKPDDVNALLGVAGPNLFGMILLGLNGGFGAKDCAALHWRDVDLDGAVLTFPRTKNNIPRTVPLWPETVDALRVLRRKRPHDAIVFRTKRGLPWKGTAVAHAVRRLCRACELPLTKGVNLGACRHTFATYANEVRDTDARRHILGRLLPNLDDIYHRRRLRNRVASGKPGAAGEGDAGGGAPSAPSSRSASSASGTSF
jgi:integrase